MKIKTVELKIKGMTCDHCESSVSKAIDAEGVMEKKVSYGDANAVISYDPEKLSAEEIGKMVDSTGHYRVTGYNEIGENSEETPHLVIIGGGSAAFAATIQARELGARVTMINEGLPIGGTCVNVGCVPSKNLIRAAEALHRANNIQFPGITGQAKLTDFKKIIGQKRELVGQLRRDKYINIIKDMENFRLIEGRAIFTGKKTVEVNGEKIQGDYFLIATGAGAFIPDIPGLQDTPYLTNESAFELEDLPKSMIVLGGRYIALEMAQMFSRLGSKVTVLQRSSRIIPDQDEDVSAELAKHLRAEGIEIVTGNRFSSVKKSSAGFSVKTLVDGEAVAFEAEKLVIATGRKANTDSMGLNAAGVKLDERGFVRVNDHLQTSNPAVFASGDVLGKNMFVYTAAYEGKLAVSNAFGKLPQSTDYSALPWVIFSDPQVAGVGMDEKQAQAAGIEYEATKLELAHVPRSIAARDTRGFIKLLRDKNSDRLIGVRIVAPEGSELLMEVAVAIKFGVKSEELKDMFHPYLTLSEGIKLAAITFTKSVEELSCCAT